MEILAVVTANRQSLMAQDQNQNRILQAPGVQEKAVQDQVEVEAVGQGEVPKVVKGDRMRVFKILFSIPVFITAQLFLACSSHYIQTNEKNETTTIIIIQEPVYSSPPILITYPIPPKYPKPPQSGDGEEKKKMRTNDNQRKAERGNNSSQNNTRNIGNGRNIKKGRR